MSAAIELQQVHKRFGAAPAVAALRDISLTIEQGELVSVIGPSGSGKTTLLHVMGALLRPSTGIVLIGGTATTSLNDSALSALRARRLGFVFQDYVLIAGASALDNVADGLMYRGIPRRERLRRAREALEHVGLATRTTHSPHNCPEVSASASRSPERSSANRRSCSQTNRPETSTARPATRSSTSYSRSTPPASRSPSSPTIGTSRPQHHA